VRVVDPVQKQAVVKKAPVKREVGEQVVAVEKEDFGGLMEY